MSIFENSESKLKSLDELKLDEFDRGIAGLLMKILWINSLIKEITLNIINSYMIYIIIFFFLFLL